MRDVKCNLIRDVHTCIPHDLNQKRYVKQGKSLGNGKMKGEKWCSCYFKPTWLLRAIYLLMAIKAKCNIDSWLNKTDKPNTVGKHMKRGQVLTK